MYNRHPQVRFDGLRIEFQRLLGRRYGLRTHLLRTNTNEDRAQVKVGIGKSKIGWREGWVFFNRLLEISDAPFGIGSVIAFPENPAVPNIVLHYTSFKQITADIADARVYGGIHYRTDQDAGARLGKAVGRAVYKNNLRPVHEDD